MYLKNGVSFTAKGGTLKMVFGVIPAAGAKILEKKNIALWTRFSTWTPGVHSPMDFAGDAHYVYL